MTQFLSIRSAFGTFEKDIHRKKAQICVWKEIRECHFITYDKEKIAKIWQKISCYGGNRTFILHGNTALNELLGFQPYMK